MKEVSIEEKAKRGKQKLAFCCVPSKKMILNVWQLGNLWKELTKGVCNTEHGTQVEYILKHWTEGDYYEDQKPADKVEPKFKDGDWVVNKFGDVWHIDSFDKKNYQVSNGNEYKHCYFPIEKQNEMHLWTIQDAKVGDVLICKGNIKNSNEIKYERICLFNNFDNAFFTLTKTSNFVEEYNIDVNIDYPDNTVLATKEQKEILFMVMADAGYTFDFEKKELKKIEQNPAWSEEDEKQARQIERIVHNEGYSKKLQEQIADWFKSLKDRMQPRQEWSEEDEMFVHGLIRGLAAKRDIHGHTTFSSDCIDITETINWLESLKDRYTWKPSEMQLDTIEQIIDGEPYERDLRIKLLKILKS